MSFPQLPRLATWSARTGTGLRTIQALGGHWVEQNQSKASVFARLAQEGHEVAWEFSSRQGDYTGRVSIDGKVMSSFLARQHIAGVQGNEGATPCLKS